jgi:hypothetical protein
MNISYHFECYVVAVSVLPAASGLQGSGRLKGLRHRGKVHTDTYPQASDIILLFRKCHLSGVGRSFSVTALAPAARWPIIDDSSRSRWASDQSERKSDAR